MRIGSMEWRSVDNMRFESGLTILECGDFRELRTVSEIDEGCCKACHDRGIIANVNLSREGKLYIVRPPAPVHLEREWMADFSLHLRAHVCCKLMCLVTGLPHKWWKDKSDEVKAEETWRRHTFGSPSATQETGRAPKSSATRHRSRDAEDDAIDDFRSRFR